MIILWLLFFTQALAQDLSQNISQDPSMSIIESQDLSENFAGQYPMEHTKDGKNKIPALVDEEFKYIDVLEGRDFHSYKYAEIPPPAKTSRPWPTPPYYAFMRRGSILYLNTDNTKIFRSPKDMYVLVREEIAGGKYVLLMDKEGQTKYRTQVSNTVTSHEDLKILPKPQEYRTYPKQEKYFVVDDQLKLDNYINVHAEYVQDAYLKDLFVSLLPAGTTVPDSFTAIARRFEYKVFYMWHLPIQFGLNLNYQEGSWQNEAEGLIWRSAFFGPVAQYTFLQRDEYSVNIQMSYQQSLIYEASSQTANFAFSYSTAALEFNTNLLLPSKYGHWVLGATYRRAQASLKSTTVELRRNPDRGEINSFGAVLGYNFEMDFEL